jgi:1,2-diacylglycerol 3-alpha-glucosyltransferase
LGVRERRRLKVAIVTDVYDKTNGLVISTKRFVELLRRHHDITVVTSGKPQPGRITLPELHFPLADGIIKRNNYTFAWPKKVVLEECFREMNLVHVQTPFLLGIESISIARHLGVPILCTFHVQPENVLYNIGIRSKPVIEGMYRFFIKFCYNRADAVICPSRFAQSELKRSGLRVPSYVISNGVLPQFKPSQCERDGRFGNKFIILSVGRLAREKRHDVLIKAASKSKYRDRLQLIIAGSGPLESRLARMGKTLPNTPVFCNLPQQKLIDLYNSADLYVHPATAEIEGMAVLEAIACGLPALVSDSQKSATGQFALNEKFLFTSGRPVDLSHKIDYWIEHKKELQEYHKRYRGFSRRFLIDESIKKLDCLYRKYARNRDPLRGTGRDPRRDTLQRP